MDHQEWCEKEKNNEWVIKTLKLFFFMQKNFQNVHKNWCSWPILINIQGATFFKKASDAIEDHIEDLDNHMMTVVEEDL